MVIVGSPVLLPCVGRVIGGKNIRIALNYTNWDKSQKQTEPPKDLAIPHYKMFSLYLKKKKTFATSNAWEFTPTLK